MYPPTSKARRARPASSGFSLVELMVAMAASLILLGAVFVLLGQLFTVSQSAANIADMNQNLRAGVDLIARDLTRASSGIPLGGIPLPSGAGSVGVFRPPNSLAQTFPTCTGVYSAITPGPGLGPVVIPGTPPTDAITLLTVDSTFMPSPAEPAPLTFSSITGDPVGCSPSSCAGWIATINTANPPMPAGFSVNLGTSPATFSLNGTVVSQLNKGDLMMFSNSQGTALGVVTNYNPSNNTIQFDVDTGGYDPLRINQPAAASGTLWNLATPPFSTTFPPTVAYKVLMISYYLDNSLPSGPRLMQAIDAAPPNPVATGINKLYFTYDLFEGTLNGVSDIINGLLPVCSHSPNEIRKVNLQVAAASAPLSTNAKRYYVNQIVTGVTIRDLAYRNRY